jgi:PAS domain S-box-containing protein
MTTAATISIVAASLDAVLGYLCLRLSRAPGWRRMRLFGVMALLAAIYSLTNVPQTLDVKPWIVVVTGQFSLTAAALHLAGWIAYTSDPHGGGQLSRFDRIVLAVLIGLATMALVPGAFMRSTTRVVEVRWLDLRYQTPEATVAGLGALFLLFLIMFIPTVRYLRMVWRGASSGGAQLVGFLILLATTINDMAIASGLIEGPCLIDLGFLALVLTFSTEMIRQTVHGSIALQQTSERYRQLVDNTDTGFMVIDGKGTVLSANDSYMRLAGRKGPEETIGHSVIEWTAPDQHEHNAAAVAICAEKGLIQDFETVYQHRDGRRIQITINATAQGTPDGPKQLVSFCRDITERKHAELERARLEDQLRMSQKMEAIGGLAGGVAHDFNNLLSLILNYTGFAMNASPEGDPRRDDLAQVKKAAERAALLTRQLLAFSRKQVLHLVALDLNQIAMGMEKMFRRILGEDVEFVQVLAADLGLTLADPGQIEHVLMNLVANARDAMPDGGKLTIETANVEIDEEFAASLVGVKPGSFVRLAVTDTGRGIDQQDQARIFEPFFTTKEKDKGTGLGLSMVFGIVKQSGGDIQVSSEPGKGSAFTIYLPRELSAATATPTTPRTLPIQSRGSETILVVEDEEALLEVAKRALEESGYHVLTAADGNEALLVHARHASDIHLLLTDVVMPRMSGRVLADRLRSTQPTLKILYMSGYTNDAIGRHGVLDPGTHLLAKPFTGADLTRMVREVLDGSITTVTDEHPHATEPDADVKERPLEKAGILTLPEDVRNRLCQAVIAARYEEIVEIIETIGNSKPEVAAGLRRMADDFDYDGIRQFLR